MTQTLVIGDIHGCYDELQMLLEAAALTADDQIIAVGDLIDRGPKPADVIRFFIETPNAHAILGNQDDLHLQAAAGDIRLPKAQKITRLLMGDALYETTLDYLAELPLYIELPDALIVHGYYKAGIALDDQRDDVLLGTAKRRIIKTGKRKGWFKKYDGKKPIIVGHRDYSGEKQVFDYEGRVYGIDTRCVYGGALTGVLLPEWRFVRVEAQRNHWRRLRKQYKRGKLEAGL